MNKESLHEVYVHYTSRAGCCIKRKAQRVSERRKLGGQTSERSKQYTTSCLFHVYLDGEKRIRFPCTVNIVLDGVIRETGEAVVWKGGMMNADNTLAPFNRQLRPS